MNRREPDHDPRRDDARPAEDAALERELRDLPRPGASPDFRARMREGFLDGSIAPASEGAAAPEATRRAIPLLVALAAVVVVAGVLAVWSGASDALRFEVFDASGEGLVRVDGREIPADDRGALAAALVPGATVEVPDGVTLVVVIPEVALFEPVAGTRFRLPRVPTTGGEEAEGELLCEVERGEVRFVSGARFPGRALAFTTPHGRVRITGTIVSVQCNERGTCVCVLEGTALVGRDRGDLVEVTEGSRRVIPAEGEPSISPVVAPHEHGIEDLIERIGDRFPR